MSKKSSKKKFDPMTLSVMILVAGVTFAALFGLQRQFFGDTEATPPSLCYLANEGFAASSGDQMVLMDAFYRDSFPEDKVMPESLQQALLEAAAPYDTTDIITVSHRHVDHFNAEMLMAHLARNRQAHLILPPEAYAEFMATDGSETFAGQVTASYPERGRTEVVSRNGIDVIVYNLDHRTDVENIGVMFELGGKTLFHMGDYSSLDFEENGLVDLEVDYLLAPYWYFISDENAALVTDNISAQYIVPIHIPRRDAPADFLERIGGDWNAMIEGLRVRLPNMLVMVDDGACVRPAEDDQSG